MHDRSRKPIRTVAQMEAEMGRLKAELREAKEHEKDPAAVALGRRGGLKGGKARADSLDPERRAEIARRAAAVRWNKGD